MSSDAFDSLPRAGQPLTTVEAYRAMLRLLEYYFHVDSEFPVGGILGDLAAGAAPEKYRSLPVDGSDRESL